MFTFGRSKLKGDILSFDIAQLAKPLAKHREPRAFVARRRQESDSPYLRWSLGLGDERREETA